MALIVSDDDIRLAINIAMANIEHGEIAAAQKALAHALILFEARIADHEREYILVEFKDDD
jgi:hypothetical protein